MIMNERSAELREQAVALRRAGKKNRGLGRSGHG